MKVLQIGKFFPVRGGVEKVMYDLTLGLSSRGIECDMLCATISGKGRRLVLNKSADIISCRTWVQLASTMITPTMCSTLRKIAPDYDIIHIHHPDPMAAMALRLSGYRGKVVLHWHSDILKQKFLLRLISPLQNWLLRRADVVLTTSPYYLSQSPYLVDVRNKAKVCPIGIKPLTPDFAGAEEIRKKYPGRKIVFSLGRLVPYKGYRYLVDAARSLPSDYIILIGGNGPLRDELQSQIDNGGLQDRVVLLGGISARLLPAYYQACDVFCLPSVAKTEAFGIVQIEAMSIGKPVVTTTIEGSGVPWVNEHGVSGLNVPVCDSGALADAIVRITASPADYARFSSGARNRFFSTFTHDNMIDLCLETYLNL